MNSPTEVVRHRARSHRGARSLALLVALAVGSTVMTGVVGAATTTTTVDPGRLTQTRAEPAFGAPLAFQLRQLWNALVADDATMGRTVFFPRTAYLKMKTGVIANPSGDYASRLIGLFNLDVHAYHRRLEQGGRPTLVRYSYETGHAAWIAPGSCENSIGYWHLGHVRYVYRHGSSLYSVDVFSLISWHGVWYVVHLGPNPRAVDVGTVDGYARGPGSPGPPGGC